MSFQMKDVMASVVWWLNVLLIFVSASQDIQEMDILAHVCEHCTNFSKKQFTEASIQRCSEQLFLRTLLVIIYKDEKI